MRPAEQTAGNPHIGVMEIPDPFAFRDLNRNERGEIAYHEPKLTVVRTLRDDPLARLHDRAQITDIQYHAGRLWQALYEDSQGAGGLRSSGDIKEHVDGSPPLAGPITDKRQKATKRIIQLDHALGGFGAMMVRDVLVSGRTMAKVSLAHGMIANDKTLLYLGRRFRECLDTLAGELGLA